MYCHIEYRMEVYIFMCMLSVVRKTVSYSRGNVFFLLNPANAVFFFQFLTDMNKMNLTKKIPHPVARTYAARKIQIFKQFQAVNKIFEFQADDLFCFSKNCVAKITNLMNIFNQPGLVFVILKCWDHLHGFQKSVQILPGGFAPKKI